MTKITFAAGLGSTGSSALVDYLREFNDFYSPDDEFRLFVDPDGLVNLRNALTDDWTIFQSDIALKRYSKLVKQVNRKWLGNYFRLDHRKYYDNYLIERSKSFIQDLTRVKYNGLWYGINNAYLAYMVRSNFINKFLSRRFYNSKEIMVGYKLSQDEFDKITNDYISDIVNYSCKKNEKSFCFNENFSAMFPSKITSMVKGSKIVLVIRDPKDVYSDSLRVKWLGMPGDFESYLKWQKAIFNGWLDIQKSAEFDCEKILVVKFEELVLDYDTTTKKINNFLCLDIEDHNCKFKYFNPERSKKNIGQWKSKLSEEQVNRINSELKDFMEYYNYK